MKYGHLDEQMRAFGSALVADVGLRAADVGDLATTIAREVNALPPDARAAVVEASPIPLSARLEELTAFQSWMDQASQESNPSVTRAQVIVQTYVCFVYLSEACFRALRRVCPPGSVTRSCCEYLTGNRVRSLRNAVAHSNWTYSADFSGLVYWARKGERPDAQLERFEVKQAELSFWQALSRCVGYAAYTTLAASPTPGATRLG